MGVLQDVFCGVDGIDKLLHDTLGGTAVITHKGERFFDDELNQWSVAEPDVTESVSFIPLPMDSFNEDVKKMFLEENIKIVGTVAACDLTTFPSLENDTITYRGESYVIVKTVAEPIENDTAHITIYGTK